MNNETNETLEKIKTAICKIEHRRTKINKTKRPMNNFNSLISVLGTLRALTFTHNLLIKDFAGKSYSESNMI